MARKRRKYQMSTEIIPCKLSPSSNKGFEPAEVNAKEATVNRKYRHDRKSR